MARGRAGLAGAALPGAPGDLSYHGRLPGLRGPGVRVPRLRICHAVAITNAGGTYTTTPALEVFVTLGLAWEGAHATNPSFWDVGTTANWKPLSGGAATTYTNDFSVLLNDAAVTTAVAMQGDVEPQGTVFNNSAKDYTLTGEFGIGGGGGIIKNGTGVVELLNSNYLTGATVVNNGILKVGNGTSGTLGTATAITINGGALHLNDPAAATFTNTVTIGAAGQLAIKGTGDYTLGGGIISGAGSELFDRNGVVLVNRANLISTATINSGEVAFTGNQEANRLANGAAITVASGATMTVRGVNALPTGEFGESHHQSRNPQSDFQRRQPLASGQHHPQWRGHRLRQFRRHRLQRRELPAQWQHAHHGLHPVDDCLRHRRQQRQLGDRHQRP